MKIIVLIGGTEGEITLHEQHWKWILSIRRHLQAHSSQMQWANTLPPSCYTSSSFSSSPPDVIYVEQLKMTFGLYVVLLDILKVGERDGGSWDF